MHSGSRRRMRKLTRTGNPSRNVRLVRSDNRRVRHGKASLDIAREGEEELVSLGLDEIGFSA